MEIIEREYGLKSGFAYIVFKENGTEYTLQACLMERKECKDGKRRWKMIQTNRPLFKKVINSDDDGMDWGISGDTNAPAFDKFGTDFCMKLFKKEIKKVGIRFQ